ncbi:GNAT family N-acetyltransferase [Flavobacterium sp.]|jgi:hypothetical protein|uniref:GNAT family N-acetyltransferase n=1 Tax=Flavobacterium sp. TaxID=239 RepID=UPI0037BED774
MNKVLINPENYKSKYIEYLNLCFPNWGSDTQYNWAFERKIGKHHSDILLLANEEDEIIAGSGLSFRMIKTNDGVIHDIAIFTGSWTLPNARGRGCFTQIIELFEQICIEKNVPFLTAFVTESNGSYRRFVDLNYYCLEANNILSNETPFENVPLFEIVFLEKKQSLDLFESFTNNAKNKTVFHYDKEEWLGQYVNRTNDTSVISIDDNYFLVEENESTFRILFYKDFNIEHIKAISNVMLETKKKKTMFFLTDKTNIEVCESENFNVVKGFFTVKNCVGDQSEAEGIFKNLVINLSDKM